MQRPDKQIIRYIESAMMRVRGEGNKYKQYQKEMVFPLINKPIIANSDVSIPSSVTKI